MARYWIPGQISIWKYLLIFLIVQSTDANHLKIESQGVVCYGVYGCFRPFHTAMDMPLPLSPHRIRTKFFLHTHPHSTVHQMINDTRTIVENSNFDHTKRTKIIVHGFAPTNAVVAKWVSKMTQTIMAKDDVNVIVVDWVGGAAVAYDQAVGNTRLVGAQIANLVRTIMDVHNYDPKKVHIIGFSLGAHVAGFAGKELIKHNEEHKIGRITGLDPANPGFNFDSPHVRLDKIDAHFVDVIHTDMKTLLVVASGLNRNIGHADYYPNGGASQPGCNTWNSDSSLVSAVTDMTVCDHVRAPKLFMESINATDDCDFAAYRCPSYEQFQEGRCVRCESRKTKKGGKNRCNKLGYWAEPPTVKKQVKYYLHTSESAPYCAKHYQVMLHWRKGPGSTKVGFRGSIYVKLHGDKGSTKEFALNDGVTFNIVPGKASRFLVSHPCNEDIGHVDRVTFRWERPTCWTYFFCSTENVYLKRVKLIDAMEQKRHIFLPLEMDKNGDGRKDIIEVKAGATQQLFRKSYIRSRHPQSLNSQAKTKALRRSTVVPPVISPGQKDDQVGQKGQLLTRVAGQRQYNKDNNNDNISQLQSELLYNSPNTGSHST